MFTFHSRSTCKQKCIQNDIENARVRIKRLLHLRTLHAFQTPIVDLYATLKVFGVNFWYFQIVLIFLKYSRVLIKVQNRSRVFTKVKRNATYPPSHSGATDSWERSCPLWTTRFFLGTGDSLNVTIIVFCYL